MFGTSDTLQIDVIWCEDLPAAKKIKAELEQGKDFEAVKEQCSLQKKSKPFHTQPSSEGLFWKELWAAAEPGRVLGPVKGFYSQGVKWRIVKILEKKPGQAKEYDSKMDSQIKGMMMSEQSKELISQYGRELLKKYPHEIYADRVREIDLLDIP
jgi:hypothetical protein